MLEKEKKSEEREAMSVNEKQQECAELLLLINYDVFL
jgi:hypothetical protein